MIATATYPIAPLTSAAQSALATYLPAVLVGVGVVIAIFIVIELCHKVFGWIGWDD